MRIGPGTVAVITGAASGIGRALAVELAGRGSDLALVDINEAGLQETRQLLDREGSKTSLHVVDVADQQAMRLLPPAVIREHGSVHVLVNNAGVSVAGPITSLKLDDFEWLMGVNFWGVVYGCRFFLPYLKREKAASVCNILSDFALIGFPTKSPYCASKFAVRGFSESLQAELEGSTVHCTCVYLGPVSTELIRSSRAWSESRKMKEAEFVDRRGMPAEKVARRIRRAIEREKPRVLIGRETYLIDLLTRFSPAATRAFVARMRTRLPFL